MRTQRILVKTAVFAALLALGGSVLSGCADVKPSSDRDFELRISPVWTVRANLIGTPVAANGVVVSYVSTEDGGLQIVAWNSRTGAELWRDDAVTGGMTTGVELGASVVETNGRTLVPYLRDMPDNDFDWQQLVIADAATGVGVPVDRAAVWVSERPTSCPDDSGVCFSGWTFNARLAGQRSFRFDPESGTVRPDADLALPEGARFLGERVFSTDRRAPDGSEMLGYSAGGTTLWQRPYTDVFGTGYSSDGGWSWEKSDPDGLIIGSGSTYEPGLSDGREYSYDVTQQRTVALSRETGATAWSLDRVGECATGAVPADLVERIVPLCRWNTGRLDVSKEKDSDYPDFRYSHLDIDLIGVDNQTGRIEWTVPLGDEPTAAFSKESSFFSHTTQRPVEVSGTVVILDVLTGDYSPAPTDGIYACSTYRDGFLADLPGDSSTELVRFNDGDDVHPCDVDRADVHSDVFSPGSIRMAGVEAGDGHYVVGNSTGLNGYHLEG